MPDKITSKNLHYEDRLPPFLARLRGQQPDSSSQSPDPILAARRRPARIRSASEEAEDAPVVVDEEGNVVHVDPKSLDEGEAGDENKEGRAEEDAKSSGAKRKEPESEKVASIGASKKRKTGRVVGGEDGEDEDARIARAVKAVREAAAEDGATAERRGVGNPIKTGYKKKTGKDGDIKGGKKKAKWIKLSFGDDDGD
jgi:hypothetical protein